MYYNKILSFSLKNRLKIVKQAQTMNIISSASLYSYGFALVTIIPKYSFFFSFCGTTEPLRFAFE